MISSVKQIPISGKIACIGELGLRGEIRSASMIKKRINELIKLGFTGVYLPKAQEDEFKNEKLKIKLNFINNISELISTV